MSDEEIDTKTRNEAERQFREFKDEELVQFIRDTVVRLEVLADRLDSVADKKEGEGDAGKHARASNH